MLEARQLSVDERHNNQFGDDVTGDDSYEQNLQQYGREPFILGQATSEFYDRLQCRILVIDHCVGVRVMADRMEYLLLLG